MLVCQRTVGDSLADRLITQPRLAFGLLEQAWEMVQPLHRQFGPGSSAERWVLVPRGSIPATFERKLTGGQALGLMAGLGTGRLDQAEREGVRRTVAATVARLQRLQAGPDGALIDRAGGIAFGDLKPEHVIYDHRSGAPRLCDPMLTEAAPVADAAKLVSRSILAVYASTEPGRAAIGVADGISGFIDARLREQQPGDRASWSRALVLLWAMDALNIATTYLSAPTELAVPEPVSTVGTWASRMVGLACVLADSLASSDGRAALRAGLDHLRGCT